MIKQFCIASLAIAAICIPFQTSAGIKSVPNGCDYRGDTGQQIQPGTQPSRSARHLIETISQLERKLAVARQKLAEELRVHPIQSRGDADVIHHPAIVSAYISSRLGVNRGSTDNIKLGDRVVIIRRNGPSLTIVADGSVTDVTPSFCSISLSHNLAGVMIEDEVYLLNNPASGCSIANIQIDNSQK